MIEETLGQMIEIKKVIAFISTNTFANTLISIVMSGVGLQRLFEWKAKRNQKKILLTLLYHELTSTADYGSVSRNIKKPGYMNPPRLFAIENILSSNILSYRTDKELIKGLYEIDGWYKSLKPVINSKNDLLFSGDELAIDGYNEMITKGYKKMYQVIKEYIVLLENKYKCKNLK